MTCNCITEMNAKLAPHNGRVAQAIRITADLGRMFSSTVIGTEKLDKSKRKPIPTLMATFCPFCGKRENEEQAK